MATKKVTRDAFFAALATFEAECARHARRNNRKVGSFAALRDGWWNEIETGTRTLEEVIIFAVKLGMMMSGAQTDLRWPK